jgi:hypothetical protein
LIERFGELTHVRAKSASSAAACILDEAKPLFGLQKTGTHWLVLKKKIYILRQEYSSQVLLADIDSKDPVRLTTAFRDRIRAVLCFRDLAGIGPTTERKIELRKGADDDTWVPLSLDDIPTVTNLDYTISTVMATRWFSESKEITELNPAYQKLIHRAFGAGTLAEHTAQCRAALDTIAARVAPDAIGIVSVVVNRLLSRATRK